jgi:iron-sulfur cluster assembly protein
MQFTLFKISPAACAQIRLATTQAEAAGLALRLAATRAPDGSIDYLMGFDAAQATDVRIQPEPDVLLVFMPIYEALLAGAAMDYVELEPGKFHFIFINPNDAHYQPPQEG